MKINQNIQIQEMHTKYKSDKKKNINICWMYFNRLMILFFYIKQIFVLKISPMIDLNAVKLLFSVVKLIIIIKQCE